MNSEEGWQMWNARLKKLRLPKLKFHSARGSWQNHAVWENSCCLTDWVIRQYAALYEQVHLILKVTELLWGQSSAQCLRISIDFQLLPVCSYNVTKTLVFSILRWYVSIEEAFPLSITCLVKHPKYCSAGPVLVGCLSFPLCNLGLDYGV